MITYRLSYSTLLLILMTEELFSDPELLSELSDRLLLSELLPVRFYLRLKALKQLRIHQESIFQW